MAPLLQVDNLCFEYPDMTVFEQVNFSVEPGSLLHIRGKNGAGKTTLLKLLAGLFPPSEGTISFENRPIEKNTELYTSSMAYMGHKLGTSQLLTIKENTLYGFNTSFNKPLYIELLESLNLTQYEDTQCALLSEGTKRKVALLCMMLKQAKIWLLDEPFVSLDKQTTDVLKHFMQKCLAGEGAIIMTSHQPLKLTGIEHEEFTL